MIVARTFLFFLSFYRAEGEPSPTSGKDCAKMTLSHTEEYQLELVDCDQPYFAVIGICEYYMDRISNCMILSLYSVILAV